MIKILHKPYGTHIRARVTRYTDDPSLYFGAIMPLYIQGF